MPTPPVIGPAVITYDDTTIEPAKVTQNGSSARVYQWDADAKRWVIHDSISDVEFVEKAGYLELTGVSATLREEIGLSRADATVTMQIRSKACASCG